MNAAAVPGLLPGLFGETGLAERLVAVMDAPAFAPAALLVAVLAGAGHAVAPGHGKSLATAYLLGTDGRARDAVWFAGSVAAMHTVSVLVLALLWTFASLSDWIRLQQLTTGLQLLGGLLVIGVGVWLLRRHRAHHHHHHHHHHSHHSHGHGHAARPGLLTLGAAGGLTPSPAAFLLLVAGLFSGRAGLAMVLVLAFGLGLAAVLLVVGLAALRGKALVLRFAGATRLVGHAARHTPLLAACGITLLGCGITSLAVINLVAA